MLMSLHDLDGAGELKASTVIVGAGAVGLMMAVDLARQGQDVIVLEAGGTSVEKASQQFFENAVSVGANLEGMHLGRFRVLGGTTTFWGGQLVRFDPCVFEPRTWLGDKTAWPLSRADLDPYYDRVLTLAGMEAALIDDEEVFRRLSVTPPQPPESLGLFFSRWTPETNFARLFQKEIAERPNLRVITDAPAVALSADETGRRITGVECQDRNGRRMLVRGGNVVLANGTIEIARLLSLPLADGRRAAWADNPWLGRGFMDHVDCVAGEVHPIDRKRFHEVFDNAFVDGVKYNPKVKLSEKAQKDLGLVGISCHFIFNSSFAEHLTNAKIFFRGLLKGRVDGSFLSYPGQLLTLVRVGLPMMIRYLRYRRMYNPADQGIQLRLTSEQIMVRESGLRLRNDRDGLDMPMVEMDWRIDGGEIETFARFAELVRDYLAESGLAEVRIHQKLLDRDPTYLSTIDDANHQMGMARMAKDPADGVVSGDLRVHGAENLFVAGAATFPSTGFPNPTFTAMALGLRLVDLLKKET
jgi:choline dehydrogenase-like flavoprotein